MSTDTIRSAEATPKLDIICLATQINKLMLRYLDTFEACSSLPRLSLLPIPKLIVQLFFWEICIVLSVYAVIIDLILFVIRRRSRRPNLIIGAPLYKTIGRPFYGAWMGDISAFKFSRIRYLTLIMLMYHAQFKINALRNSFNRQYFKIVITDPDNAATTDEAEKLSKNLSLFEEIASGTYKLGVFVVGGPLLVILSLLTQHVLLPMIAYFWKIVTGSEFSIEQLGQLDKLGQLEVFAVLFTIFATWTLVPTWMDMRRLLGENSLPKLEREVYHEAKMKYHMDFPFDILFYIVVWMIPAGITVSGLFSHNWQVTSHADHLSDAVSSVIAYLILLGIGIIALIRRIVLEQL
jgi:hypothetical protein